MANNTISYALRENLLTADPDDCMAQVVDARTYTQDDIIKEMVKRGTSLTEADIAAYQKLEQEVYKDIIASGGHLNTPLINTSFSITGVFALTAGGEVRCETVIENKPARLLVILPASMEAGEFTVEVRTKTTGKSSARASKTLKRGAFGKALTAVKG